MFSCELKSLGLLADVARLTDDKEVVLVSDYQYASLLDMPNSKPVFVPHDTIRGLRWGSVALDKALQFMLFVITMLCDLCAGVPPLKRDTTWANKMLFNQNIINMVFQNGNIGVQEL